MGGGGGGGHTPRRNILILKIGHEQDSSSKIPRLLVEFIFHNIESRNVLITRIQNATDQ